ncbi:restriction modification system DNA specificity domain [Marivirga tractuosa DSM 4126]|uniref:Restriction modification system DNA specificity domain n=2 Tax=Marivirga TaxID=869806 RepID=E4TMV1_MARTH|nr:restriction modification system DNA specificity domain [Marivirga tractuosa DSM 4126]
MDICTKITDGTHHTPKYTESGVPFFRVTDITASNNSKKYISNEEHLELIKRCHPEKGDILYSKNGTIGVGKIVDWDFEFSIFVSLCLIKPNHKIVNTKYLNYFLNTSFALRQALKYSKVATIKNLHLVEIKKLKVPLPPLAVQERIAAILDAADELRQKDQALLKKYDDLIQSLFLDMFGDPVSNSKNLKVKPLGELCDFYSGKAWKKAELGSYGYKLVRISNLHKPNFPYWLYEGEMIEKLKVEAGDLLFSWAGVQASIDVYLYDGETGMLNQHIYNLKPKKNSPNKEYLFNLLKLHLRNLRSSLGGGVGQFHLKKSDITSIKVLIPDEATMQVFLDSLSILNDQKQQAQANIKKSEELFQSLLQKAFKGELVSELESKVSNK